MVKGKCQANQDTLAPLERLGQVEMPTGEAPGARLGRHLRLGQGVVSIVYAMGSCQRIF